MGQCRAVFLDLHGTLGDQGRQGIHDFAVYPFAGEAVQLLNTTTLLTVLVTNQSRIARGEMSHQDFAVFIERLKGHLAERAAWLDAVYYCPHRAEDKCACRKPEPGLLYQSQRDLDCDLSQSYLVGDVGAWDMVLARKVGCRAILVRTGWGEGSLGEFRELWAEIEPDYVADDLFDAAGWIVAQEQLRLGLQHGG